MTAQTSFTDLLSSRFTVAVSDPGQGEITRSYLLHLPARYNTNNSVRVPLVLDFHCRTCTATSQMSSAWPQVADQDQEGFVYLALEGGSQELYFVINLFLLRYE